MLTEPIRNGICGVCTISLLSACFKSIKKKESQLMRKFVCSISCFIILVAAIMPMPSFANQTAYSGTQLFEGVFFGQGPVATIFTGALSPRQPLSVSAAQLMKRTESRIAARDPDFFRQIARDFTSGDPGLVSAGLTSGQRALRSMLSFRARSATDSFTIVDHDGDNTLVLATMVDNYGIAVVTSCQVVLCPNARSTNFQTASLVRLITARLART